MRPINDIKKSLLVEAVAASCCVACKDGLPCCAQEEADTSAWKKVAQKLLDKNTDESQVGFGYRVYMRAIIAGTPTTHLTKLKGDRGKGALKARADLIDERGKLDEGLALHRKGDQIKIRGLAYTVAANEGPLDGEDGELARRLMIQHPRGAVYELEIARDRDDAWSMRRIGMMVGQDLQPMGGKKIRLSPSEVVGMRTHLQVTEGEVAEEKTKAQKNFVDRCVAAMTSKMSDAEVQQASDTDKKNPWAICTAQAKKSPEAVAEKESKGMKGRKTQYKQAITRFRKARKAASDDQ